MDGDVDGDDFLIWQTNFGSTAGEGAGTVPEPTAATLVGILLAILAGAAASRTGRA